MRFLRAESGCRNVRGIICGRSARDRQRAAMEFGACGDSSGTTTKCQRNGWKRIRWSCGEITLTSQNGKQERKKEENGFGTERDAVLQTAFPLQDIAFSCTGDEARWSCFETWNYCSESGRGAAAVCHGRTSGRTGNRAAEHRRGERRRWGRC